MPRLLNVLHVLDHSVPLFSGYSFRSRNIVQFQQALGIHPSVLTSPKHGSIRDECQEQEGVRYYRTGPAPGGGVFGQPFLREIRLMARLGQRLAEVVRLEKVDLIHSHSPLLNGLPALWVARRFGLPLIYEARAFWEDAAVDHGTFGEGSLRYRISRGLEMFLFKRAQAVVTICDNMRQELISRGIAPEKIQVVPNGVDVEWFEPQPKPAQLMQQLGLNGHPVFGFIGSFYHYEGLRVLLEAFPEIARRVPGVRLLLVGGGMEESILREMARRCREGVIFAGQIPHDNVRDYYALIDVFVFPRRRMRLTELVTPLKPLEAMAMTKAVLASDVGGHRELIQDEVNGILFATESREALVSSVVRAVQDPELRRRLGAAGRNYVANERNWPTLVQRYAKLYEGLGAKSKAHSAWSRPETEDR